MKTHQKQITIGAIASIVAILIAIPTDSFSQYPGGGMRSGSYSGGPGGMPGGGMRGGPGGMQGGGMPGGFGGGPFGGGMRGGPGGMQGGGMPGGFGGGPFGGGMRGGPGGMQGGGMPGGFGGGPFGGMPGGPGGMMPGRSGNDAERNLRTVSILENMDTNKDGRLDPREIPEGRRPFVQMIAQRLGVDPNKTIDLRALKRKFSTASTSGSSATQGMIALPENPIIPYFGEVATTISTVAVLGFGQKEVENQPLTAQQSGAQRRRQQQQRQAADPDAQLQIITRTARELMSKNDRNRNGVLDKLNDEWNSLPFDANAADKNKDGRLTLNEIVMALGGKPSASMGAARGAVVQMSFADRLPAVVPAWFTERDKDKDGQLTLLEYAAGEEFNDVMLSEFRANDRNNDGLITIEECYAFLKAHEEKERKAKEAAEIEAARANPAAAGNDQKDDQPPSEQKEGDEKSSDNQSGGNQESRPEPSPSVERTDRPGPPSNRERDRNRPAYRQGDGSSPNSGSPPSTNQQRGRGRRR